MCEWLRDGAVGPVREVQAWASARAHIHHKGRPADTPPIPEGLDWNMWLGPRGPRPYSQ